MVQRSSTLVVSIEPSAQLVYTPYNEGTLEDNDLIATSMPLKLARKSHAADLRQVEGARHRSCSTACASVGFKLDFGEDNTGWQFKYLTRGGGYYFNVGCSDLIVKGEIALKQFADIETFTADGAKMKDGEIIAADLIVLATGYKPQEELVRKLFGDAVDQPRRPDLGLWRRARSCATCMRAPASPASGSSPAASRNAGSARSISRCRSRRSRKGCCRA